MTESRLASTLRSVRAVVIGGSAGGLTALEQVLWDLAQPLPVPVVVVLHLPAGARSALAEVLGRVSGWPASEPVDKEPLEAGRIYVAPAGYHLMIERGPAFALSVDEPVRHSRPSIDVLFESAADVFGSRLMAIVLSGANADGADGLRRVCAAGGLGVVQSPAEASSPEMPRAAREASPEAIERTAAGIRELLLAVPPPARAGAAPGENRKKTNA